jgi:hypothetical protein
MPRVAVARLAHQRLELQHALRPLHHRATRRRPPARRDAAAETRDHVQPSAPPDQRGRLDRRRVPPGIRRRSRPHIRHRVPRPDARVLALPRPQVRPHHAGRLLQPRLVLQRDRRGRHLSIRDRRHAAPRDAPQHARAKRVARRTPRQSHGRRNSPCQRRGRRADESTPGSSRRLSRRATATAGTSVQARGPRARQTLAAGRKCRLSRGQSHALRRRRWRDIQ